MAIVNLTVSRTETGVEIDDELAGGETGVDFGTVPNNGYSLTQNLHIRHNGDNEITELAIYIQPYYGMYGGAFTASDDYNKIIALGDDSTGDYGLHFDEDYNAVSPFDTFYTFKTGSGVSFETRRTIPSSAFYYRDPVTAEKSDPTAPIAGHLGSDDDTQKAQDLGNRVQCRMRVGLPQTEIEGGIRQWSTIFSYIYTS